MSGKARPSALLLLFILSACGGVSNNLNDTNGAVGESWRNIYPSVKASWASAKASIDPVTLALPRDNLLPKSHAHIQKILERLLARNGLPPDTAALAIAGCEVASAEANPETRTIRFCRGLLAIVQYDDDVAFILAHELGHILLGHPSAARTMQNSSTGRLVNGVGLAVVVGGAFIPGVGGIVASTAGRALAPTASSRTKLKLAEINRSEEYEADQTGIELMITAGYDPKCAAGILDSLSAMVDAPVEKARGFADANGETAKTWQSISANKRGILPNSELRTHPTIRQRIDAVQELVATRHQNIGGTKKTDLLTSEERDNYLQLRDAVFGGAGTAGLASTDTNFVLLSAWRALNSHNPKAALAELEKLPESDAGISDRWARMAAIAAIYLNDTSQARTFADKHYLSQEFKRRDPADQSDFSGESGAIEPILALYASDEIKKKVSKFQCLKSKALITLGGCVVDGPDDEPKLWSATHVRQYIEAGARWQG